MPCLLQMKSLAQMLTLANIHAGSKVLVFETCAGLVLGAVMERMGGTSVGFSIRPNNGRFSLQRVNFLSDLFLSLLYN